MAAGEGFQSILRLLNLAAAGSIGFPKKVEGFAVLPFYSHRTQTLAQIAKVWQAEKGVDNRVFSNLWESEIKIASPTLVGDETEEEKSGESKWGSTEHYFQCAKYALSDRNLMRLLNSNDVAAYGQRRMVVTEDHVALIAQLQAQGVPHPPLTLQARVSPVLKAAHWDDDKIPVMYRALRAKFTQHPDLNRQLLATGDAWLIEHTKNDTQWADGATGVGTNFLGKLLVTLRQELRSSDLPSTWDHTISTPDFIAFLKAPQNQFIRYLEKK